MGQGFSSEIHSGERSTATGMEADGVRRRGGWCPALGQKASMRPSRSLAEERKELGHTSTQRGDAPSAAPRGGVAMEEVDGQAEDEHQAEVEYEVQLVQILMNSVLKVSNVIDVVLL